MDIMRAAPTVICTGNQRTACPGMSMARIETAPAGGMNMAICFILNKTNVCACAFCSV